MRLAGSENPHKSDQDPIFLKTGFGSDLPEKPDPDSIFLKKQDPDPIFLQKTDPYPTLQRNRILPSRKTGSKMQIIYANLRNSKINGFISVFHVYLSISCAACSKVPSNISTMGYALYDLYAYSPIEFRIIVVIKKVAADK